MHRPVAPEVGHSRVADPLRLADATVEVLGRIFEQGLDVLGLLRELAVDVQAARADVRVVLDRQVVALVGLPRDVDEAVADIIDTEVQAGTIEQAAERFRTAEPESEVGLVTLADDAISPAGADWWWD